MWSQHDLEPLQHDYLSGPMNYMHLGPMIGKQSWKDTGYIKIKYLKYITILINFRNTILIEKSR